MIYKGQIIYIYQIKQKIKETFIIHKKGHYLTQKKKQTLLLLLFCTLSISAAEDETNPVTWCPHHNAVKSESVRKRKNHK